MGLTVSWRESSCPHRPVQPVTPCRSALMSLRASSSLRTCANRVKWEALSISPLQRKSWSGVIERLWDKKFPCSSAEHHNKFHRPYIIWTFPFILIWKQCEKKENPTGHLKFLRILCSQYILAEWQKHMQQPPPKWTLLQSSFKEIYTFRI